MLLPKLLLVLKPVVAAPCNSSCRGDYLRHARLHGRRWGFTLAVITAVHHHHLMLLLALLLLRLAALVVAG